MQYELIQGDCIEILQGFDDDIFDSIVTDPPYGLEFMGKSWDKPGNLWASRDKSMDLTGKSSSPFLAARVNKYVAGHEYQAWCQEWATECLRVLKPGGYLLAFGGTRTYHRLACAIEDAGFEIRDSLDWIYGSGFPKSLDVSKAIDKQAGAEREVIGKLNNPAGNNAGNSDNLIELGLKSDAYVTAPATEAAKQWAGWGTALKPAHEPIVMARKPLAKGHTVAANVLEFGTGGINIDGCRVGTEVTTMHSRGKNTAFPKRPGETTVEESGRSKPQNLVGPAVRRDDNTVYGKGLGVGIQEEPEGRWPPNVILSQESAEEMDRQSGISNSNGGSGKASRQSQGGNTFIGLGGGDKPGAHLGGLGDVGGASRFFPCFRYQAKAPKSERPQVDGIASHPTVKPVALMQWLVRLVTPYGGYVLDPFAGTGTTAEACELEGFDCLLIERDPDSARLIEKRMEKAK